MSLVKEIEKELKQKSNDVEAVEDILIQDSVLDHSEVADFNKYEDTTPGEIRKRAPIDLGSEYSGKPISRKAFSTSKLQANSDLQNALRVLLSDNEEDQQSSEIEEENEQSKLKTLDLEKEQSGTDLDEDEANEKEDDSHGEDDDSHGEDDDSQGEDDDSQGEEEASESEEESEDNESDQYDDDVNLADYENEKQTEEKGKIEIFSAKAKDVGSDVSKGNAIRNQLSIWETLLECRIKMQPCMIAGNQLYQKENFEKFKSELTPDDESVIDKTYASLSNMMKTLLDVQEALSLVSSEYQNFVKTQESLKNNSLDDHKDGEEEEEEEEEEREYDDDDDDDDESIASSLASGEIQEKEIESENISSEDKVIEEGPKPKKAKVETSKNFIKDTYEQFKPFGESSIRKWYEKTKVASGKASNSDFSAFDQSPLKQIEHILYDKDRLIKKTQLLRSDYGILGKNIEEEEEKPIDDVEVVTTKSKVQNEYDEEIFDDNDFYHKLLRDFIERKSTDVTDPLKHGRQWLELQKMRSKLKRKIDTKASKGRKLRYTVHNKLVSFMAPVPNNQWTPEAEEKLFSSLFGKAVVK